MLGGGSENGSKAQSDGFGGFMGGRPGGRGSDNSTEETGTSMKGLKASSGLLISGGSIAIDSADDAIHAEDTLTITAGEIVISESYESLEALHIEVQGGSIDLTASDDSLNAAGGTDQSGTTGGRDGMFGGGRGGRPGGGLAVCPAIRTAASKFTAVIA